MSDSLCRLSVQAGEGHDVVDLALPSNAHVGLLMPSIVGIVHRDAITPVERRRWRLSRVGGPALDESMTLTENDVHEGDLLMLTTTEPPAPEWVKDDPFSSVASITGEGRGPARLVVAAVVGLCATGISAVALACSGTIAGTAGHIVTGAVLAATAAVAAIVARRANPGPLPCVTLAVIAVGFCAVVGFLAVPGGPSAANLLLASAAGLSMSTLMLHVIRCGTVCLTAIATFTAMAIPAAAGCVMWTLSAEAVGAAIATLSLGGLSVAARLSIAMAGLAPATPRSDDPADDEPDSANINEDRAVLAHQTMTGLVVGLSSCAALGAVLVAWTGALDGTSRLSATTFTAVVGLVALLRARTHADARRRIALGAGGLVSLAAGFVVVVVSAPGQANWVSAVAAAAGIAVVGGIFGMPVNPVARRAVELLDYLALAAVVPLACWVGDLYGLVRSVSLS